jgi:Dimerisation domain
MNNDPSQIVGELIFGRWRSQILYAGVKLGVFDALGDGSKTSSDIAEVLGLDSALTYRLLRAFASWACCTKMRECLWLNLLCRDLIRHISQSCLIST